VREFWCSTPLFLVAVVRTGCLRLRLWAFTGAMFVEVHCLVVQYSTRCVGQCQAGVLCTYYVHVFFAFKVCAVSIRALAACWLLLLHFCFPCCGQVLWDVALRLPLQVGPSQQYDLCIPWVSARA
jgi:hypothetical protein